MPTVEWGIPFQLVTTQGTLLINQADYTADSSGLFFLLDKTKCSAGPLPLRVTVDSMPQADGSILHRAFKSGYRIQLGLQLWQTRELVACDTVVREMWDLLMAHLNALLNDDGRIIWSPSGYPDDRMFTNIRLLDWPTVNYDGAITEVQFSVHTRFPYAIDATEIDTNISDGDTAIIHNDGTTDVYPVVEVYGSATSFVIQNDTTGLALQYNSGTPGGVAIPGGQYGEFIFFRNTAYLNGTGANLKAGIDLNLSDFFPLVPGPNVILAAGADMLIKSWNAWP